MEELQMFTENSWFQPAAVNELYRVYGDALQELRRYPEDTTWEGSDDDMLVLATRIFDLAFLGERDPIQLRRGAMRHFGYVRPSDPVPQRIGEIVRLLETGKALVECDAPMARTGLRRCV
jgi:hypothetical protein